MACSFSVLLFIGGVTLGFVAGVWAVTGGEK